MSVFSVFSVLSVIVQIMKFGRNREIWLKLRQLSKIVNCCPSFEIKLQFCNLVGLLWFYMVKMAKNPTILISQQLGYVLGLGEISKVKIIIRLTYFSM